MDSVSSVNSGVSTLFNTLSASSPQFAQLLNTPGVSSALQNASPNVILQLSDQALELQQLGVLFGTSGSVQTNDPLLGLLNPPVAASTPGIGSASQVNPIAALFNPQPTTGSLLDVQA